MYSATNQFSELQYLGPQNKPNGVRGLGKNYHMHFYPKLGHGTCEMHQIPCACPPCTCMLNQPWYPGIPAQQKPRYQPVKDFTFCHVLGYFNN